MARLNTNQFAGIEYVGTAGITQHCVLAVVRILQIGRIPARATILSSEGSHCLLLEDEVGRTTAIKSGFSSGYFGEGPKGLSYVLRLLEAYGVEVEEVEVSEEVLARVDRSCLSTADLKVIFGAGPVRPQRWHEYIHDGREWSSNRDDLWDEFPLIVPMAAMDRRIADLALRFSVDPDSTLMSAYRRLEDIVRSRTGIEDEIGVKLFSRAFQGDASKLIWQGLASAEQSGRANLFIGAFLAYRNPRAHQERNSSEHDQLVEFLLINHLFLLEAAAVVRNESLDELRR